MHITNETCKHSVSTCFEHPLPNEHSNGFNSFEPSPEASDASTLQCTAADGATAGGTRLSFVQLPPVMCMLRVYTDVQTQQSTNSSNKDVASLSHAQRTPVWKYLRAHMHAPQGVGKV